MAQALHSNVFGTAPDAPVAVLQCPLKRPSNQRGIFRGYPYPPIIAALKPILRASIEAAPTGGVVTVGREGRTPLHKEPPFDLSPIRRDRTIHVSASPIKKGATPNPPGSHTTWILFFYEALPPWAHTKDVYLLGPIIFSFFPPL
jgi:hypothetical protein